MSNKAARSRAIVQDLFLSVQRITSKSPARNRPASFCKSPLIAHLAVSLLSLSASLGLPDLGIADDTPTVMVVPGKFEVNSVGAATYTVPVMALPGTAGVKPDLSLDYSSDHADGPEGLGWTIGGIPAITRCARTAAQDNVHGGVNYNSNDRFCFNGQRLVAINGTYGADKTEYRLEVDNFTKIVSYGAAGSGPEYFIAQTKSGQQLQFGSTTGNGTASSALIVPVPGSKTGPAGTVRTWGLDTLWDTKGNYFRVIYDNGEPDSINGQLYPTQINYTYNNGQNLSAFNSVQFSYTSRTDINPTYQAGSVMQFTVLLTDIVTCTAVPHPGSGCPSGNVVLDYKLGYQTAAQAAQDAGLGSGAANAFHDELRTIKECNNTGGCLPTVSMGWGGGTLPEMSNTTDSYTPNSAFLAGDFNGDGVTDVLVGAPIFKPYFPVVFQYDCSDGLSQIQLGSRSGSFTQSSMTVLLAGQNNPIVACFGDNLTNNLFPVAIGDEDGDGFSDVFQGAVSFNNTNNEFVQPTISYSYATTGDFDGSGRTGIYLTDPGRYTGLPNIYLYFSNGTIDKNPYGTFILGTTYSPVLTQDGRYSDWVTETVPADFDGDGCADVLMRTDYMYSSEVFYSCKPAVATISPPSAMFPKECNGQTEIYGDFNGDGKSDVLVLRPQSACGNPGLYLSTGTGFITSTFSVPSDWYMYEVVSGDFNGDGKTDIALIAPGCTGSGGCYGPPQPHSIWLSTGTGFVQAYTISNTNPKNEGATANSSPVGNPVGFTPAVMGYVGD